ncbi:hypothetical protein ACIBCO_39190 [Streptomyces violascens]|uniref:hypothetical protein n=1 Tax=Streptomyces violascens TaxID=67381 RepID=UPI00378E4616
MGVGWVVLVVGFVWLLFGAVLAVSDVLAWRRRVIVPARCTSLNDELDGIVRHLLERQPIGREEPLVLLRTKGARVEVGAPVKLSYDPKRPHQVFIAAEHPRIEHTTGVAMSAGIGFLLVLAVLISRIG